MNIKTSLAVLLGTFLAVNAAKTTSAATPNPFASQVDLDTLFKKMNLDFCNAMCVGSLKPAIRKVLELVDSYDALGGMCTAYDRMLDCQKKSFCIKNQALQIITSGVEDLCKSNKHTIIVENESCIKPKLDAISQQCDQQCEVVKALADYSHDPAIQKSLTVFQLVDHLDGVCRGLTCFLNCIRPKLNDPACPTVGSTIASGVLHPFDIAASFIGKLAPNVQTLIVQKLPQSCTPLVNSTVLHNIVDGNTV